MLVVRFFLLLLANSRPRWPMSLVFLNSGHVTDEDYKSRDKPNDGLTFRQQSKTCNPRSNFRTVRQNERG